MSMNKWFNLSRGGFRQALVAGAVGACLVAGPVAAADKPVKIRVQSVIPTSADEVVMLKRFGDDVTALTGGTVTFEILPAGAVVAVNETLDAVDKGLIEAGFAWTHYWSGKHPAAMLFGSPSAGAGVGMDNFAWLSWFQSGGGAELYNQLWKEMKVNIHGLMLQPVGPEALGWFKEPIKDMDAFRKLRFRTPPGIPGQIYKDIGIASVAMGGGDILPALEKGVIDAAEWCCPKPDMNFGFQKVLKHYYLQGLHQNIVNADIYINGDVWKKISDGQRKAMEVAANASLMQAVSYPDLENGRALKDDRATRRDPAQHAGRVFQGVQSRGTRSFEEEAATRTPSSRRSGTARRRLPTSPSRSGPAQRSQRGHWPLTPKNWPRKVSRWAHQRP
ncbi:MAG: hypothetical protein R3E68_03595 [Burkholderiaceae bacterium]